MFNETHVDTINGSERLLAFIKSANIKAYPCGHRRSIVEEDLNTDGNIDRIPFDPEARLNTEANNRKHSSLNGYTQTYLKELNIDKKLLTLALAGHLFNITLDYEDCDTVDKVANAFGAEVYDKLDKAASTAENNKKAYIYANIALEEVPLYKGFQNYTTTVLRNQTGTSNEQPKSAIDLLLTEIKNEQDGPNKLAKMDDPASYYFSGLSFSTEPITGFTGTRTEKTISIERNYNGFNEVTQTLVSLCILKFEESSDSWKIYEPAYLPFIEHGDTEDSIVVTGDALMKRDLKIKGKTDVSGNITSYSNIMASGNTETAGNISADRNIHAYKDITADRFLNVKDNAKILKNLTVGPEADGDGEGTPGTITAKTHVETPTLNASISTTTPTSTVTTALNVKKAKSDDPAATANIDKAIINEAEITNANIQEATITEKLTVTNDSPDDAILSNAAVTGQLIVKNPAYDADNPEDSAALPAELVADIAGIDALSAGTIEADDIQQKIGNDHYAVPVIFLEPKAEDNKTFYQLQISRVNHKN